MNVEINNGAAKFALGAVLIAFLTTPASLAQPPTASGCTQSASMEFGLNSSSPLAVATFPVSVNATETPTLVIQNLGPAHSVGKQRTPEKSWAWRLDFPTGSHAQLTNTTTLNVSFTPDKTGPYTVHLNDCGNKCTIKLVTDFVNGKPFIEDSDISDPETSPQVFDVTHLLDFFYGVTWSLDRKERKFDDPATEAEEGIDSWSRAAESAGLIPLAILPALWRTGDVIVDASGPVIRGTFRGDAERLQDTLNDPLIDALVERLVSLPMPGRQPSYVNLNIGRWNPDNPTVDLAPLAERLRSLARSKAAVVLGGRAPIFAYLLAMHTALDANQQTEILVADPKAAQFLVEIPPRSLSAPDVVSPYFEAEMMLDDAGRWCFHHKTVDQFLPFSVTGNLPFAPPVPPSVAARRKVTVWVFARSRSTAFIRGGCGERGCGVSLFGMRRLGWMSACFAPSPSKIRNVDICAATPTSSKKTLDRGAGEFDPC
jgi:hypothetical protein